jgi:hypothetical protein
MERRWKSIGRKMETILEISRNRLLIKVDMDGERWNPIVRKAETGQKFRKTWGAKGGIWWKAGENQLEERWKLFWKSAGNDCKLSRQGWRKAETNRKKGGNRTEILENSGRKKLNLTEGGWKSIGWERKLSWKEDETLGKIISIGTDTNLFARRNGCRENGKKSYRWGSQGQ